MSPSIKEVWIEISCITFKNEWGKGILCPNFCIQFQPALYTFCTFIMQFHITDLRDGTNMENHVSSISLSVSCPASMLQHILNQNPIPPACILHKHMCHRSCQLPILYDRRTAHE